MLTPLTVVVGPGEWTRCRPRRLDRRCTSGKGGGGSGNERRDVSHTKKKFGIETDPIEGQVRRVGVYGYVEEVSSQ